MVIFEGFLACSRIENGMDAKVTCDRRTAIFLVTTRCFARLFLLGGQKSVYVKCFVGRKDKVGIVLDALCCHPVLDLIRLCYLISALSHSDILLWVSLRVLSCSLLLANTTLISMQRASIHSIQRSGLNHHLMQLVMTSSGVWTVLKSSKKTGRSILHLWRPRTIQSEIHRSSSDKWYWNRTSTQREYHRRRSEVHCRIWDHCICRGNKRAV